MVDIELCIKCDVILLYSDFRENATRHGTRIDNTRLPQFFLLALRDDTAYMQLTTPTFGSDIWGANPIRNIKNIWPSHFTKYNFLAVFAQKLQTQHWDKTYCGCSTFFALTYQISIYMNSLNKVSYKYIPGTSRCSSGYYMEWAARVLILVIITAPIALANHNMSIS